MKLPKHHTHAEKDGNLRFFVPSDSYPAILAHLKKKKLNAGGSHKKPADESEIVVEATYAQVKAALADLDLE